MTKVFLDSLAWLEEKENAVLRVKLVLPAIHVMADLDCLVAPEQLVRRENLDSPACMD